MSELRFAALVSLTVIAVILLGHQARPILHVAYSHAGLL